MDLSIRDSRSRVLPRYQMLLHMYLEPLGNFETGVSYVDMLYSYLTVKEPLAIGMRIRGVEL